MAGLIHLLMRDVSNGMDTWTTPVAAYTDRDEAVAVCELLNIELEPYQIGVLGLTGPAAAASRAFIRQYDDEGEYLRDTYYSVLTIEQR